MPRTGSPAPEPQPEPLITATLMAGLELIATRRLGNVDEARDAAQESLARAVAAIRAGRAPAAAEFELYVYGILRHVIADMRRRPAPLTLSDAAPAPGPSALECIVSAERRAAVRDAFDRLGADDQALLTRCFAEGRRIVAIAGDTGEPPDRLRKRKSRALQRLRALLDGHEIRPGPMRLP